MAEEEGQHHFPYAIEDVDAEKNEKIKADFEGYLSGAVVVGPERYFFQGIYRKYAARYTTFPFRPTDVVVASYPKCGTTWTQELVWLLVHDLDYTGAQVDLDVRFPFLELDHIMDCQVFQRPELRDRLPVPPPQPWENFQLALDLPDPRTLKTHMPFSLLPPNLLQTCKVVYVARDPRDVVVSYYHHHRMWVTHGFVRDFNTFFRYFLKEEVLYSPFWSHVREAWQRRNQPNLLLITYNQLKADLPAVIRKVAAFIGKTLSESELERLTKHLHIDSMKNNSSVNFEAWGSSGVLDLKEGGFIRQGKRGGWREYFDDSMKEEFEKWMREKGQGLEAELNWLY